MDYNHHMDYVEKSDRMANSYSISFSTFKWTKKLSLTCWTWTFSTATFFILHVGVRKCHIEFFVIP